MLTLRAGLADGAGIALRPLFAGFALVTLGAGVTLRALQRAVVYPSARHAVVDVNVIRLGRADAVGIANGGILHRGLECRDRAIIALYNKAGAGFTLLSGVAFVTLGALRAAFALRAGFTRNTLCPRNALRACLALRALWACLAPRPPLTGFALRAFEVDGRGVGLAAVVRPAQIARSGDGRRECRAVCAGCSILTGSAVRACGAGRTPRRLPGILVAEIPVPVCSDRRRNAVFTVCALEIGNGNEVFPRRAIVVAVLDVATRDAHIDGARSSGASAGSCRLVDSRDKVLLGLCCQVVQVADLRLNRIEPALGRLVRRLCACMERRNAHRVIDAGFHKNVLYAPLELHLAISGVFDVRCADRPIRRVAVHGKRHGVRLRVPAGARTLD